MSDTTTQPEALRLIERARTIFVPYTSDSMEFRKMVSEMERMYAEIERLTLRLKMTSDTMNSYMLERDTAQADLARARQELVAACEREKVTVEALQHINATILRQLDLIAERAPGNFLDKRPVVQALSAHVRTIAKALNPPAINQTKGGAV